MYVAVVWILAPLELGLAQALVDPTLCLGMGITIQGRGNRHA